MRITWGATILALAVAAAGAGRSMTAVEAAGQAAPAAVTVEQFPGLMKAISSGAQGANGKIKANDLAGAAKDAQAAAAAFGEVEKFFASKSKADAVAWAQTGKMAATNAATALAAGDGAKAATELGTMGTTCKQCHSAYREGGPQAGGYKFKEGSI